MSPADPRPAAELVDRIVLDEPHGGSRELTLDDFFELPLNVRVRHLIERKVKFFKDGRELNAQRVLAELREANVASHRPGPRSPRSG